MQKKQQKKQQKIKPYFLRLSTGDHSRLKKYCKQAGISMVSFIRNSIEQIPDNDKQAEVN